MNRKILKAALAGTAVVALAAGGGTWSSWSDWGTITGSHAGADELSLVLGEPNSSHFDNMHLAPGVKHDYEFVVASRQGDTVPLADLKFKLTNLVGHEDGCTSTNSEAAVDPDCANTASEGEFLDQALINMNISTPSSDPDACSAAHSRGSIIAPITLRSLRDNTATLPTQLTQLAPGQYVCVAMGLGMPQSANNASQGDSANFDLTFLLEQHL